MCCVVAAPQSAREALKAKLKADAAVCTVDANINMCYFSCHILRCNSLRVRR